MYSIHPDYLNQIQLDLKQLASLQFISEYKGKQNLWLRQSPEALDALRKVAMVESTESSNRLEGIIVDHSRLRDIVLKSTHPRDRSEQEIAGYRDALNLIHESYKSLSFSIHIIQHLHELMLKHVSIPGGQWKQTNNQIIERYANGTFRIRFIPIPAAETAEAMESLVSQYASAHNEQITSLILIPATIFDFLCIHPFQDGNGRMARLLTLLLLYHAGYIVGKYISLERIIEESKETYYEVLEHSSQRWHQGKHDIIPWVNYFWGMLIRAYKEFEARVGTVTSGRGSKSQLVRLAVKRKLTPFAISDIQDDCPTISRDMIRIVLNDLRDKGFLRLEGKGRGAKWVKVQEKWVE